METSVASTLAAGQTGDRWPLSRHRGDVKLQYSGRLAFAQKELPDAAGQLGNSVDYFRLFFAYTGLHVPRTGKLEARGGSV